MDFYAALDREKWFKEFKKILKRVKVHGNLNNKNNTGGKVILKHLANKQTYRKKDDKLVIR